MGDLEERIKRIEEVLNYYFKLSRILRRKYNKTTKLFDGNFDVVDEETKRNTANIDKIVNTLEELMGLEKSGKVAEKKEDDYTRRLYL